MRLLSLFTNPVEFYHITWNQAITFLAQNIDGTLYREQCIHRFDVATYLAIFIHVCDLHVATAFFVD